jgi:sn-glycerol 3-phosphate transport system substrate-binding protein
VNTAGAALVDNDNGRAARAQHALLDSGPVTEVLGFLDSMNDAGLLEITGRGGDQAALSKFVAVGLGNATMTIASSASLGEIYNQLERAPGVDLRVGPFPGLSGGTTAVGGGSLYLVNETTDAEQAAVWDFMTWLNEPAQQVRWSIGTGYIPTRSSAIDDPELQALWAERPGFRVAFDQLARPGELPGGGGPVIGDFLGFRDAIEDGLEALYAGDDPAEVQAAMQSNADQAIADYNRRIGG